MSVKMLYDETHFRNLVLDGDTLDCKKEDSKTGFFTWFTHDVYHKKELTN